MDRHEEIENRLKFYGSHQRIAPLIDELRSIHRADLFWRVFQDWWNACDDTWRFRRALIDELRKWSPIPLHLMTKVNREFYNSLPNEIVVYRGCSLDRTHGISWTTDRSVAAGFARGHRGIDIADPVLCEAVVQKSAKCIMFFDNDRDESEVLIDTSSRSFCLEARPMESVDRAPDFSA